MEHIVPRISLKHSHQKWEQFTQTYRSVNLLVIQTQEPLDQNKQIDIGNTQSLDFDPTVGGVGELILLDAHLDALDDFLDIIYDDLGEVVVAFLKLLIEVLLLYVVVVIGTLSFLGESGQHLDQNMANDGCFGIVVHSTAVDDLEKSAQSFVVEEKSIENFLGTSYVPTLL